MRVAVERRLDSGLELVERLALEHPAKSHFGEFLEGLQVVHLDEVRPAVPGALAW
jgi:hypothetical protein